MQATSNQDPGFLGYFLSRAAAARQTFLFIFHAAVFTVCYIFAWLIRFEFDVPAEYVASFATSLPSIVAIELTIGFFFGFYKGWWRYVGIADVVRLVLGLSAALLLQITIWFACSLFDWHEIAERVTGVSRGVLLINWAFALLTLFGSRVLIRIAQDWMRHDPAGFQSRKVLIIGAGDAGETLAREIEHRPQLGMKVVGFIDDHTAKRKSFIRGIEVLGPISEIEEIADATGATEALIAIPSASGARIREIIRQLAAADLRFKTIPGIDQLVSGKVHLSQQLRPVNVEDLLRRKRIELPGDPVRALFTGKRVLVTGAGGTIGSELATQILKLEPEHVVLLERSEFALYECNRRLEREEPWLMQLVSRQLGDIRDLEAISRLLEREKPHIVLHAAAHKHVPLGEENPGEYVRNNCLATRRLAEMCERAGVERFVLISTDKAINPSSVMGASKRAAEIALLDLARDGNMKIKVVRFGNVIGSSGSVVPLFLEQIANGGPVTVTHPDATRYFLLTSEAVALVLQAAALEDAGRVFMLDMGEPVRIVDLARDLIQLSNQTLDDIPIHFTGLRPGEKLFEEIRLQGESIHPTAHPQIVITEAPQPDRRTVLGALQDLERAASGSSADSLRSLKALIPEYTLPSRTAGVAATVTDPQSAAMMAPALSNAPTE